MPRLSHRDVYWASRRLGARISALRTRKGITQMVMAEKVGVSFQIYQKYEYGTISVSIGRLYDIADVLEVPVSELLAGLTNDLPHLRFSDDEHEIISLFRKIKNADAAYEALEKLEQFVREKEEKEEKEEK